MPCGRRTSGRRLAGVSRPESRRHLPRKGALEAVAQGRAETALEGTGLGIGNSAPSVVGNVLYTMGQKDDQEWVLALDISREGKQLWAIAHRPGPQQRQRISRPALDADHRRQPPLHPGHRRRHRLHGRQRRPDHLASRRRQGFRRPGSRTGDMPSRFGRRALGDLHARRARRPRSPRSTRTTAGWSGARPSAIRPTMPRSSR